MFLRSGLGLILTAGVAPAIVRRASLPAFMRTTGDRFTLDDLRLLREAAKETQIHGPHKIIVTPYAVALYSRHLVEVANRASRIGPR